MKTFSGFPDGELKMSALPEMFYTGLLPLIDDLLELKVTRRLLSPVLAEERAGALDDLGGVDARSGVERCAARRSPPAC